jgi:hypothetical protein
MQKMFGNASSPLRPTALSVFICCKEVSMESRLARVALLGAFAVSGLLFVASPQPVRAQSLGDFAENGGVAAVAAGNVLRDAMASRKAERAAAKEQARRQALAGDVAKAGMPGAAPAAAGLPVPESLETPKPGFLHPNSPGIAFTADIDSSYASGKTGYPQNNLPGGFDVAAYIAPLKYSRIFAGYYEESFYPIGFDEGNVPTYVQNSADGQAAPGAPGRQYCGAIGPTMANDIGLLPNCNTDLANVYKLPTNGPLDTHFKNDASTRQRVIILSEQNIFWVGLFGMFKGGFLPIVVSPTYAVAKSDVAGASDVYPSYNPSTGTYQFLHLRSNEIEQVLVSLPFADSEKLFGVYTIGPQRNVNSNGNNQSNHPQIFQVLDLRYFANDSTTLFFQPTILQAEYPVDPYPQRTVSLITGFQHKIGGPKSPLFVQGLLEEGGPTNPPYGHSGRIGVVDVTCVTNFPTCVQNPDPKSDIAVTYGGFKASTFQLQVGIGNPSVIPI